MITIKKIIYIFVIIFIIYILFKLYNKKSLFEFFNNDENGNKIIPGKTIWLLWLQGWDNAPWFIHKIKDSWIKHNPEWNVELVSESNLSNYINITFPSNASHAEISDIIRLNLLYEHGGVWADATMLCMMPLELWLYNVIEPCGFWMYHGNTDCQGPASWFIISMKKSHIISKWKKECDNYWKDRSEPHDYFWMDSLFYNLLSNDKDFALQWQNVPDLCCENVGQAHMLAGKYFNNDPELKDILKNKPPFAVKLSRHGAPDSLTDEFKNTNMYFAIDTTLNRNDKNYILPEIKYVEFNNIFNKDKVIVIADCNNEKEIIELKPICDDNNIQMIIYDKCNFGKHVSNEIYCRPLKNVGREQSTYLHFIITNYDYLPYDIYFLPGNINKHNRKQRFIDMLNDKNIMGSCQQLGGSQDFTIDIHENKQQYPAEVRPFKSWFEKYVGLWNDNDIGPCWTGIMHTNRERIKKHSKDYFIRILNQLEVDNNPEAGHYAERSMAQIF